MSGEPPRDLPNTANRPVYAGSEGKRIGTLDTLRTLASRATNFLKPGGRKTEEPETLAKGTKTTAAPAAPTEETPKE